MLRFYRVILLVVGVMFPFYLKEATVTAVQPAISGEDIGYALRHSTTGDDIVAFPLDDPKAEQLITGYGPLVGADFVDDVFTHWYTLTENNVLSRQNVSSGQPVVIGGPVPLVGEIWRGMTWDRTTRTMYAVASTDCNGAAPSASLYTIDITTGDAARIGLVTHGRCLVDVAAHPTTGVLYAIDSHTNATLTIDKSTGAGTIFGSTGIDVDQGRQGLDFHDGNGTLYYTALVSNFGELMTVSTTNGTATLIGIFGFNTYRDAFAIPAAPAPTAVTVGMHYVSPVIPAGYPALAFGSVTLVALFINRKLRARNSTGH